MNRGPIEPQLLKRRPGMGRDLMVRERDDDDDRSLRVERQAMCGGLAPPLIRQRIHVLQRGLLTRPRRLDHHDVVRLL